MVTFDVQTALATYSVRFSGPKLRDLKDKVQESGASNVYSQVYNGFIKRLFKEMGMIEHGVNAKFYDPREILKNEVKGTNLSVWSGIKASVIMFLDGPKLQVDVSTRVFRLETALDFMRGFSNANQAKEEIVGCSVLASYGNHKTYRVDNLNTTMTPMSTFEKNGQQITFVEYYESTYRVKIKDLKQPLLEHFVYKRQKQYHETKEIVQTLYLIPELMRMTGLTDELRGDHKLMQSLAIYTKLDPDDRYRRIEQHVRSLQAACQQYKMPIVIKPPVYIQETLLPIPEIQVQNQSLRPQNGNFQMRDRIVAPVDLTKWFLVGPSRGQRDDQDIDMFIDTMMKSSKAYGVRIQEPCVITLRPQARVDTWKKEIEIEVSHTGKPQIIVALLPSKNTRLYADLKKLFVQEMGIQSQVVVANSLRKNAMSVCSKILLQMEAKLSAILWKVPQPLTRQKKIMLMGIDVYHKLIDKRNSCVGICATMDKDFLQIHSDVIIQKPGQELAQHMKDQTIRALQEYKQVNGCFPDLVVVYRDGVGEGMIRFLEEIEVRAMLDAIRSMNTEKPIQFVYFMLNKKINDRFFVNRNQRMSNPPSGTAVWRKIQANGFQFELQANAVGQGTATPVRFTCLANTDAMLTEKDLVELSFRQCFQYYNWFGAVRVPAVVQNAHKLAWLSGDTFHGEPSERLTETLHFL